MLTGELKSMIDQIWSTVWSGGIANPLNLLRKITCLLSLRRHGELHVLGENKDKHWTTPTELDAKFAPLQHRAYAREL